MKKRWLSLLAGILAMSLIGLSACTPKEPAEGSSASTTQSAADTGTENTDSTATTSASESTDATDTSGSNSTSATSGPGTVTVQSTPQKTETSSKTPISKDDAEEIIKSLDLKGATVKILTNLDANSKDGRALKERFKTYCNGNLIFITSSYETMGERLTSLILANDSPDIYSVRNWDFPAMMYKDVFQELDSKIDFNAKEWVGDKEKYDRYLWQGKHYIIGSAGVNYYVWYNKQLMEEYGIEKDPGELAKEGKWNWDTFLEISKVMTDAESGQYGFLDNGAGILYAFMSAMDVDLIKLTDAGIESDVKSPGMAKAMNFYGDLYNKHKVTYASTNAVQDFANRKSAMLYDGHWIAQSDPIKSMHDSGEISFTHIPKAPGSSGYIYPAQVGGYAIPKGAKNMDGAVAFLTMGQVSQAYQKEEDAKFQKTNGLTDAEMAIVLEARKCNNLPMYSFGINDASSAFWNALNNLRGGSSWSSLTAALDPQVIKAIDDLSK